MTVPSETSATIDPREVSLYAGHFDALWGVAWSPDGTRLLSGSHDGTARVWDASRGTELFALAGPSLSISAVAWSPDGTRLLTAAEDHSVRVWDATTGADLLTLGVGGSGVGGAVAWSPDSTRILTSFDDASARIWDASSGQVVRTLSGHTEHLTAVSWSPDGTRVATASDDGTARVWDVTTGTELLRVGPMAFVGRGATMGPDGRPTHVGPIEPMTGLSWSPDSRRIITAFDSAEPRVWDAATGEEVLSLHGRERRWVEIPGDPDALLLVLHGSLQSSNVMRNFTDRTFEGLGPTVVYPDGVKHHFNDLRAGFNEDARRMRIDDVGFLTKVVEHYSADTVIGCGFSNGGQMIMRLLFDAPGLLHSACVFASTLGAGANHAPSTR